jgi:hypothetical protein
MATGHTYIHVYSRAGNGRDLATCDFCEKEKSLRVVGQVYDLSPERNPLHMCNACSKATGFSNGIQGRNATGSAAQFL